ncbi:MAG TPA: D-alanyl-D-alanine carboxypeptidase/D-alanyl-D-alanine-endopeptidase [Burkholderiales bacterium]|nr:D-alanyl-D-alanine carboxypeptidase/D-alanyl-D-alanine-endopeptidase [Burkholderiales bacterium]
MIRVAPLLAFALVAGAPFVPGAACADALPTPVAQALARAGVPQSAVGLYVQQVDAAHPTAVFNASKPMNPASAMKLVTTFAALDLLGPAYTWKTEAYLLGRMQGDVLDGDLLLKGYGDPKLTIENFWLFLRALRARGLREIRGDLVLDRSYFDPGEHDPAGFDGEGLRPYNVGADALLVNFKAVRFFFLPNAAAQAVSVVPEPKLAQLEVAASVALRDGPCGDWRAGLKYDLQQSGAGARASFYGAMPASCGERVWNLAPLPHDQYVLGLFKSLWQELGGTFAGGVRDGRAPAGAKPFAQFESPAAAEVLRDMNKFSNNVMARQVFLTLSAETLKPPGSYDRSTRAVKAWLEARKLDLPELVIENGSGLSRTDRISPEGMGRLLLAAYQSAVMPEFIATMPLVAYDGTMRSRMRLEDVAGHAHVKTGSLNDVRAVAGYVLDRNGRRHAVVMFVNHPAANASQPAQDALLKWVHDVAR